MARHNINDLIAFLAVGNGALRVRQTSDEARA